MTIRITPHFMLDEFACKDGTPYPVERLELDGVTTWRESRLLPLAWTCETIRELCGGRPLYLVSAYRPPGYNERVGGKPGSQHPRGRAGDLRHATMTARELHDSILALYGTGELPHLGGLGLYRSFVHVDVRPRPEDNHLARWEGIRAAPELG